MLCQVLIATILIFARTSFNLKKQSQISKPSLFERNVSSIGFESKTEIDDCRLKATAIDITS